MLKKLTDTVKFYYAKLVKIVDVSLDNIVKTVEVTLSKVPAAIEDSYAILKANLNVNNIIALVLVYILYDNFSVLLKSPVQFGSILVLIAMVMDKFKVK